MKPLVPRFSPERYMGVVVLKIPAGTPKAEAYNARRWARNMALKISRSHRFDYYNHKRQKSVDNQKYPR